MGVGTQELAPLAATDVPVLVPAQPPDTRVRPVLSSAVYTSVAQEVDVPGNAIDARETTHLYHCIMGCRFVRLREVYGSERFLGLFFPRSTGKVSTSLTPIGGPVLTRHHLGICLRDKYLGLCTHLGSPSLSRPYTLLDRKTAPSLSLDESKSGSDQITGTLRPSVRSDPFSPGSRLRFSGYSRDYFVLLKLKL